ncbi:hypothetical protein H6G03_22460 [Planktothrix sp. FACHB-1375]|uniref:Uncharacterized protein n=2 Tax=Aerosakkonema funiforme TaxID=1246630 RepID=A0A926VHF6_9CYAN|nr:hypothetical protein [Aerosakkonema funiforme FACHB-1375]
MTRRVMATDARFLSVISKCDRAADERYIGLIPVIAVIDLVSENPNLHLTKFEPELGSRSVG